MLAGRYPFAQFIRVDELSKSVLQGAGNEETQERSQVAKESP